MENEGDLPASSPVIGRRRSTAARVGVAALNLLAPGLGLVRLGHLQTGLLCMCAPVAAILLLIAIAAATPIPRFAALVVAVGLLLAGIIALYVFTIVHTWRTSQLVRAKPWWSRWYSLAALVLASSFAGQLAVGLLHRYYKPFYLPGESMVPTLNKGEKIIADMRGGLRPQRGNVVLVQAGGIARIYRVAAVAGDTIEMRHGVPVINGQQAHERLIGTATYVGYEGPQPARRLEERLPGEPGTHNVLDLGEEPLADALPVRVPPGSMFLLGDNRDRAADSRVPRAEGGVELVQTSAIIGRPLYIHWSSDRSRIGTRINP
jgi:signal peptidase I